MKLYFHFIYGAIILLLIVTGVYFYPGSKPSGLPNASVNPSREVHWHADIAVIKDGQRFAFTQDEAAPDLHLHKPDFDVVHVHKSGLTWGDFLRSVGGDLTDSCLTLPNQPTSCSNLVQEGSAIATNSVLLFYINGRNVDRLADMPIADLSRVLIYFGPPLPDQTILREYGESVTSKACIYSGFCPKPEGFTDIAETCGAGEICR